MPFLTLTTTWSVFRDEIFVTGGLIMAAWLRRVVEIYGIGAGLHLNVINAAEKIIGVSVSQV